MSAPACRSISVKKPREDRVQGHGKLKTVSRRAIFSIGGNLQGRVPAAVLQSLFKNYENQVALMLLRIDVQIRA